MVGFDCSDISSDDEDVVLNPIYDDNYIPETTTTTAESIESLATKIFTKLNLTADKSADLKLPQVPKVRGAIKEFSRIMESRQSIKNLIQRQANVCEESVEKRVSEEQPAGGDELPDINENAIQFQFDEQDETTSKSECYNSSGDVINYSDAFINLSSSSCAPHDHQHSHQQHTTAKRRLCIGEIGRSISDNAAGDAAGAESISATSNSNNKKYALTDIGRSFSVAATVAAGTDDDDEDFNINSCPIPSSLHASSILSGETSVSNNNLMLATSVPVSPIGRRLQKVEHHAHQPEANFRNKKHLLRDSSFQSDSSHCSSVESLLESRKPDPEAILINLGFGPPRTEDVLSKIPKR